jgi:hypothetical protein
LQLASFFKIQININNNPREMPELEEIEKKNSLAQKGLNALTDTIDWAMKAAERAGNWGKKTAAGALGLGVGLLGGVGIATNLPLPNELKPVVVGASGSAGMGGAVLIVIEIDERRKRIQEQQRFARLQESQELTLQRLDRYPRLAPSLQSKLNYDLQTESSLLRGDSIGVVQVLPWSNDLQSNPQQNILPPAPDAE